MVRNADEDQDNFSNPFHERKRSNPYLNEPDSGPVSDYARPPRVWNCSPQVANETLEQYEPIYKLTNN